MVRLFIVAASLSLSLTGAGGAVLAQESDVQGITTSANGADVTSTTGVNPTANGAGGTIIYGDINTGPGYTSVEPPTVVQSGSTLAPSAAAPEPALEAAPAAVAAEPVASDTAVATAADLDADNYADELEGNLGLDPTNADTDADGVADGDELNLYGTEPTAFDTDGNGVSDGEELFGINTDPLIWEDFSADASPDAQQAATESPELALIEVDPTASLAQESTERVTAIDGDAAALGPGSASASPGSVTRGSGSGNALLGPDGTYSVSEVAPPNVSVSGDTDVLTVAPAGRAPEAAPDTTTTVAGCSSYLSWYDAQVAYEAAGMTDADPATVQALDPDYDGIACEEGM